MPNYYDNFIDPFELRASRFNTELDKLDAQIKANADAIASSGVEFDANAVTPQGRLTLSSTLPVPTSDVTAATTLYYLPYNGGYISIYNGTAWGLIQIPSAGVNISVPSTTNTNYDVFALDAGAGSLTLELVAWTNNTTRATAIVRQDGVYCKQGELTKRYVGTIRTTGVSGQCEDSQSKRFCWNAYNQVERFLLVTDTTDTWAYGTAAWRQARASTANQVELVVGLSEHAAEFTVVASGFTNSGFAATGIGINSTSANSAQTRGGQAGSGGIATMVSKYRGYLSIGYSYVAWLEIGSAAGGSFYGDLGDIVVQSGLSGMVRS